MKQCIFMLLLVLFCVSQQLHTFAQSTDTKTTLTTVTDTTTKVYFHPDTLTVQGKPQKINGWLLYKTNESNYVVSIKDNSKTVWLGLLSKIVKLLAGKKS